MKKLHLDLAALQVESFVSAPHDEGLGTVHAHGTADTDTDTFPDTNGSCFTDMGFPTDYCNDSRNALTVQVSCYDGTCNQAN
jgi:hypothetical protein